MPHFYIDSSALVKRYHDEDGSRFANELFQYQYGRNEKLYTSSLTAVEFCSAIMRHKNEGKITERVAVGILNIFRIEAESMLFYIDLDRPLIYNSMRLLYEHSLRSHDSIQLASGLAVMEHASKEMGYFYFVCDDERLCQAAEKENLKVLRPRSAVAHDELMRLRMA